MWKRTAPRQESEKLQHGVARVSYTLKKSAFQGREGAQAERGFLGQEGKT